MKKIGQVFLYDISHIKKNVIAMIVVLGLCVVPSLYAWFNIAASWDPYSNTNGLKVAVANTDEGYEGEILPLQINIGDTVISSLRENDQLDWTFTGKKDAVRNARAPSLIADAISFIFSVPSSCFATFTARYPANSNARTDTTGTTYIKFSIFSSSISILGFSVHLYLHLIQMTLLL